MTELDTADVLGQGQRGRDRSGSRPRWVGPAADRPPRRPTRPGHRLRTTAGRALLFLPALIMLGVFLVGPIISALYGSFTDQSLTGAAAASESFIGLENYRDLFANPLFSTSVVLTLVFLLGSGIIGQNVLGMFLAILVRGSHRVVGTVVSTIVIGAWVLPDIVACFAAYAFFSTQGTLNAVLDGLGLTEPAWLYAFPMLSVILANIWRGVAFSMLMYSAALREVPTEITEAAEVDGATGAKRFFLITLPMIRGTIATNNMLITLGTLSVFTLIYVMTRGGPANKSMTLPLLAYEQAFVYSKLGYGTAIATILLLVGAIFSTIYLRLLRGKDSVA